MDFQKLSSRICNTFHCVLLKGLILLLTILGIMVSAGTSWANVVVEGQSVGISAGIYTCNDVGSICYGQEISGKRLSGFGSVDASVSWGGYSATSGSGDASASFSMASTGGGVQMTGAMSAHVIPGQGGVRIKADGSGNGRAVLIMGFSEPTTVTLEVSFNGSSQVAGGTRGSGYVELSIYTWEGGRYRTIYFNIFGCNSSQSPCMSNTTRQVDVAVTPGQEIYVSGSTSSGVFHEAASALVNFSATVRVLGGEDQDNDGYAAEEDCDDNDPAIHPEATEVCDGIDNDCEGLSTRDLIGMEMTIRPVRGTVMITIPLSILEPKRSVMG